MKKIIAFNVFFLLSFIAFSQEICNNGIDDDGDGQIDLNDSECVCNGIGGGGTNVTSLIPNSSFEDYTCCPSSFSQLNCAVSWQQASGATSDYFNTCNYTGGTGGLNPMPLPLPNGGAGAAGFFSNPGWEENIGTCLNSPMLAGTEYTITLNIAQSMGSTTLDLTFYGTPNCGDLPWGGTGCAVGSGSWQILTSQTVTLTPNVWTPVTLTFTPGVDINAISIGGPCGGQTSGSNYYYIDDLTLNTSASFAGSNITPSGQWCDNNLDLTATTAATGGSWQWYLNGVAIAGETGATINANSYGVGLYSAVYDDGTDCAQTDYMVNLPPYPTANFSATSVCESNASGFTDNSTIGGGSITDWSWDFGGGNTSTQQNPTYTFPSDGTFPVSLVVTSDSNCTHSFSTNVTVYPEPQTNAEVVIAGFTYPIDGSVNIESCLYNTLNFNDLSTINSPDNITGYLWDFGDGNTSTQQNPQYQYTTVGNYTVSLTTQSNNSCSQTVTFPITINPTPVAGFTAVDVCQYDAVNFTNTSGVSSGSINTNTWNFGDGSADVSAVNTNHLYGTEGTYNVSLLVISDKGCRDSISQNVNIFEVPVANFSLVDTCEYEAVNFTNQSTINSGTLNHSWTFGDATNSNAQDPVHFYLAGNYMADLLVISDQGCRDSISQPVEVFEKPVASMIFTDTCENSVMIFNDNSTVGDGNISSWNWDFGDASGSSNSNNPNHTYLTDGNYNAELIVSSSHGCFDTLVETVTIFPEPATDFTTINACLYAQAEFNDNTSITAPYTISNWDWDFGDGSSGSNQNESHQYASDGIYNVTLTTTSINGCTNSQSGTVEIYPIPVAGFSSTTICVNEPPTVFTDLSTVSSGSVVGWTWDFGLGASNQQHPSFNFGNEGNFTVMLTVESNHGCLDSIENQVVVYEKPQATFTSDETRVCNPGSINFMDGSSSNSTSIDHWEWDFFNGQNPTDQNPTANYLNETGEVVYYDVQLIVTNGYGCKDTTLVNDYIAVVPTPEANFYSAPSLLTINQTETEFVNQSINSNEYAWDFGDNGQGSNEQNPTYEYPGVQQDYVVQLIAYNYDQFCSDTTYGTIIIKDVIIFYIPNIFTPDNDDYNQVWQPVFTSGVEPQDYHMWVFNRYGETIWESYDYSAAWNGHYGGELVEDGVYVWKIEFKETMSDKKHTYTGHVTIVK